MTVVSTPADVTATVQGVFGFTVDKFRLSGPDGLNTDFYGLFRSDTGQCVGRAVKAGYVPHQASDVLALVDAAATVYDGEISVKCHFRDGHHVIVEPTKAARASIFGTNDNIFPRVVITAGYDGKCFSAAMGYYRDLCKNLSIPRMIAGAAVRLRHTSGLGGGMKGLIADFQKVRDRWEQVAATAAQLQDKDVVFREVVEHVYGKAPDQKGRGATVYGVRVDDLIRRVNDERFRSGRAGTVVLDSTVSAWEAYNAVQGYVQWDAQGKRSASGEFNRILRASSDPHVIKAESFLLSV